MPGRVELDLLYSGFLEESWAPVSPLEVEGRGGGQESFCDRRAWLARAAFTPELRRLADG